MSEKLAISGSVVTTEITVAEARALADKQCTERELQANVMEALRVNGWLAFHAHRSDNSPAGDPDVHAVSRTQRRLIFAELKREGANLTAPQKVWRTWITEAGYEYRLVRPSDWDDFMAWIKPGGREVAW